MAPEEYLEKTGISNSISEAVSMLLQNRPQNPLQFLYEFFKTQTSSGGTNMMKAYKLITYNKIDDKSFTNNAFQAFQLLEIRRHGSSPSAGIRGIDFVKLIQMIMVEYPDEVVKVLISLTGIKDDQTLCFSQFLAALRSALLLESYCEEMLQIFNYLDSKSVNRVKKENLIYALGKLSTSASCKLRIPPKDDIQQMLEQFHTDSPTEINSKEFLITMLKATHNDPY